METITPSINNSSFRCWSKLPKDLLCEIVSRLYVEDRLRFSIVCNSWHCAARQRPRLSAMQPPWLMIPDSYNPQQRVSFLSLLTKDKYTVTLSIDDFAERNFVASSCGWLITTNGRGEVIMLNPLTGKQIELPPITSFLDVKPCASGTKVRRKLKGQTDIVRYDPKVNGGIPNFEAAFRGLKDLSRAYFDKAILIPACLDQSSTLTSGYTVVAIIDNYRLAIVRNGDTKWTIVRPPRSSSSSEHIRFIEIAYIGGIVYALAYSGKLFSLDISKKILEEIWSEHNDFVAGPQYNMVELANELLLVGRNYGHKCPEGNNYFITKCVNIYKLDLRKKSMVEIETLGHYCVFIGLNQALSFSTLDFPELRANSIYLTDNCLSIIHTSPEIQRDMGIFDYEEQKMVEHYNGYDPTLTWPLPLWLSPTIIDA